MRSLSDRAGFLVTANIVKFAIGIVMPIMLVRLLSHSDYGSYQQMVLVSTAAVALLTFGLPTSVFYFKSAVGREGMPALIVQTSGLLLVGGVIATAAVYFGAAPLSRLLNNPGMAHLLAIYALSIGLVIASEHSLSFLISMDRYGRAVLFEVGEAVLRVILLLVPLWLGFGFTGLVVSVVVYAAIRFTVRMAYLFLRSDVSFARLGGHWFVREQLDYSAPIAMMYVITALGTTFNRGLLAASFTPADYAIFAVGSTVLPLASIFQTSVASVLRAELPAMFRDGQLVEMVRIIRESTRKLSIIMLPGFVFALAHSYEFITVLFTNSYARSVYVFRISVFEMPLDMLILSAIPQICGKTRANMQVNFASVTFLVICSYGLIKSIGFYGVPIAGILTQYFAASLFLIVVLRLLRTTLWKLLPFPQMLRALAASAVAALASCLVPALTSSSLVNLLFEALVFGVVFAVVGTLAGVFTENDRRLIRRWLAKVLPIGAG